MEDYRAIFAELDDIDAWADQLEEELKMVKNAEWICVEHSNILCVFMNRDGEVRTIGAQYIDECFTEG